jgi:hypothetical protein
MHVPSSSGHHLKLVPSIGPDAEEQFASAEAITASTWISLMHDNLPALLHPSEYCIL